MKRVIIYISISIFLFANNLFSQNDTVNVNRLKYFIAGNITLYAGTGVLLNKLWYEQYSTGNFHFFDDSNEWLQVDKLGHAYTSYYLSKISSKGFSWVGYSPKKSAIYGSLLGVLYISSVELFDGYSNNWGASGSDIAANIGGSAIYLSQQLLWNEQRIIPKFSFSTTAYASVRPELLGSTYAEQLLKDYNGQTYWLSFNIKSLARLNKFPSWFNIALGYGADGMVGGKNNNNAEIPLNSDLDFTRRRQYYISLDIDLGRIKTKYKFVNTVFSFVNIIKFPLPTIEFTDGNVNFYPVYF